MPAKAKATPPSRFVSLDAFRGFVILTMIWVNYCSGVHDLPPWMKHAPSDLDGYTFVDLVFPGFLFIVGVAIPFALGRRVAAGVSPWSLLPRIAIRSAGLVYLGVIFVNSETYSASGTGLSEAAFALIFWPAVAITWAQPPPTWRIARWIKKLRWIAIPVLIVVTAMFRRAANDSGAPPITWLRPEWWGILGLIGWAYLFCSIAYLAVGGHTAALVALMGLELAVYVGDKHGSLPNLLGPLSQWLDVATLAGSTSSIVTAGMVAGSLFAPVPLLTKWRRPLALACFGIGLWAAGMLIRPLHGISKDHGTDAYSLVSAGEACLLFALFHVLIDLKGWTWLAVLFVPAGVNALAAYILPDFWEGVESVTHTWGVFWPFQAGWAGAANAAVITLLMLGFTTLLTKAGLRLKF